MKGVSFGSVSDNSGGSLVSFRKREMLKIILLLNISIKSSTKVAESIKLISFANRFSFLWVTDVQKF